MKYVYAVRRPGALPDVTGLDGAAVESVTAGRLEAVVTESARSPRAAGADLLAHAAVVDALWASGGVLPVRFGTRLADHQEIRRLLDRHRERLDQALETVHGHVEMAVRVLVEAQPVDGDRPPGVPATPPMSGRGYLLARAAEERVRAQERADAAERADAVHAPLAARSAAATRRPLPDPGTLMAGAYLVRQDEVEVFRATVAGLERRHTDLTLVPTGPWPPYSFAPALDDPPDDAYESAGVGGADPTAADLPLSGGM